MKRSRIQKFTDSEAREARLLTNLDRTERLLNELEELDEEISTQPDLEFDAQDIESIYIQNLVRFIRTVIRERDNHLPRAAHAPDRLSRPDRSNRNHFRGHGFSAQ